MATHRRPAQHRKPKPRTVSRGAATLCTAAAAVTGVMTFAGTASAAPGPSFNEVKQQVNQLHNDAITITDQYNGIQEQIDKLQKSANATQSRVTDEQAALQELRDQVGQIAAGQYRTGSLPAEMQLALSSDPLAFLQQAQMMDQLDAQQASRLRQLAAQTRMLEQDRSEASTQLAELDKLRQELATKKAEIQEKLNKAQQLLNTRTQEEQQRILTSNEHEGADDGRASRNEERGGTTTDTTPDANAGTASAKAEKAISFAMSKRGTPYLWGGTGPQYDCSGLTQAAFRYAGVSLGRTTYDQVKQGVAVSRANLQRGDLVFFGSAGNVYHVGIYIGGGDMIHAPRTGDVIKVAKVSTMPFYTGRRVA